MNRTRVMAWLCGTIAFALLAGCGGSSNSTDATISGTVTGLPAGTTLTLADNTTDSLTVNANGNFAFAGKIAAQGTYSVTVTTQPAGETCVVASGSGVVDFAGDSVGNVMVACNPNVSIGVVVSGLTSGSVGLHLILQNDPTKSFDVTATTNNVTYEFATALPLSEVYSVSVGSQPPGQACTVAAPPPAGYSNATGGVVGSNPILVAVNCAPVQ
jgi:hypothetical protein